MIYSTSFLPQIKKRLRLLMMKFVGIEKSVSELK